MESIKKAQIDALQGDNRKEERLRKKLAFERKNKDWMYSRIKFGYQRWVV